MARQADREPPVEAPGQPAAEAGVGGADAHWPTWEDVARLHRIPDADGAVPEPPPAPEPAVAAEPEVADDAAEPVDAVAAESEAPSDDVTEPAGPAGAPDVEPAEVSDDESDAASDDVAEAVEPAGDAPDEPAPPTDADVAEAPVDAAEPTGGEPAEEAEPSAEAVEPADEAEPPVGAAEPAVAEPEPDETVVMPPARQPEPPAEAEGRAEPDATLVVPAVAEPEPVAAAEVPPEPAAEPEPEAEPAVADDTTVLPAPVVEPEPSVPTRVSAFPATSTPAVENPRFTAGPVPTQQREPSVLDTFPVQERRRRWPLRLAIVVGILVVLAGAYVGMSYALRDKVPHGATVAGVEIGGLTSSDAVQRLTVQLAEATGAPLTVTANDVQGQIDPTAAGLTFDPQATVDGLTGVDLKDPRRLWQQVVGLGDVTPVTGVDRDALAAAVDGLSDTLSGTPVDGAIVFVDGSAHATPAADGWQLDQDAAVQQIADTWLVAARPLTLPTTVVEPAITQAETDATLADVAQHVSGGPVSVTVGDQSATLPAPTLAANASFVPQNGSLVLQMNGQALTDALLTQLPGLLTPAADAHFAFQNDTPVVVPGQPGTKLDPAQVAAAVAAAASKATDRTAALDLVPTDPAQSTAALDALGVKEIVSEFDTPLTNDHIRDINIKQGAATITGVLIRPGETFSLTQALGPVDAAHGFVEAGAIVDGQHTDAMGGGLSQVSTTTYNAAYLAGFEIVEHTPHSQWFSRYPEGREATIFTGQIDMKWKNNSPYGALVQAWVGDDHHLHVRIWGTKYWTVQSTTSARSNVHPATTVYDQSPGCVAEAKGNPGFTVSVTRQVYLGSELTNTHTWKTTYKPQNQVVCGPPPAAP